MADYTDVETVLQTIIGGIVYPNTTAQPSIAGVDIRVIRGWPSGPQLDADLGAGKVVVSIFSQMNVERITTRYPTERKTVTAPVTTFTAAVNRDTVTIGGVAGGPQYVTVILDNPAIAFSYAIQPNDTPASIAAGLAALIDQQYAPTANGAVLSIGAGRVLAARMGAAGILWRELRRQQRTFQVSVWAPNDTTRTAVGQAIDATLAAIDRIALPDGSGGRILYSHTVELDSGQRVKIYERRMFYSVDYPTTDRGPGSEITAPSAAVSAVQSI
jgi:hypothetical protein